MISNQTMTTTPIASGFGMPSCGHAFDAITGRTAMSGIDIAATGAQTGAVVRDRRALDLGYLADTEKTFPWTTAWRPPTS